ncbi:MAG: PilZ domain-containing protein [Rhodocyclaceae bacterium]|nr:PilZ domain-containing protein [Rhodocyclaceae bacterium]MDZ4216142.1 PilZ domain-containing protein [Rhodocyclaceae bacterium]
MENFGMGLLHDKRHHARIDAHLPVTIKDERGLVRDISVDGMFILQDQQQETGSHIELWVHLDTPSGTIKLHCDGEVSRIEEIDGQVGIGIKVLKQFGMQLLLENLDDSSPSPLLRRDH